MTAGPEIEFKFLFGESDTAKIKALVPASAGAGKPSYQNLHAVYFDTPDCDLWKHGFTLRVRANGKNHIQTVKRNAPSVILRDEWEEETGQLEPDLDLIRKTPLARLAAKSPVCNALRPAFEVNVERTSYRLEAGGGVIDVAIDQGAIEANGEQLGVRELELELISGDRRALFNVARAYVSQAPLHPSLISKAERGYLLAGGVWGRAAKGSKPRLGKDMTCGQAFQKICLTCLRDFHLNIPGMERLDNDEAVHQGRIAIRRLRAALTLFKPMAFDISYRKMRGELKWLARLLGAARDLDVLQANLPPPGARDPADARLRELATRCDAERLHARQAAVEGLNSARGRILLLDLAVWLEDGMWLRQSSGIAEAPIQGFAGLRLKKRLKKLVKQGADLADLPPGPRHQVRIEAKELRYMADFFVDVRGVAKDQKRLKKLIGCCEKLQEALGAIRDAEAMAEFVANEVREKADDGTVTAILASRRPSQGKGSTEKELKRALRSYSQLAAIDAF